MVALRGGLFQGPVQDPFGRPVAWTACATWLSFWGRVRAGWRAFVSFPDYAGLRAVLPELCGRCRGVFVPQVRAKFKARKYTITL